MSTEKQSDLSLLEHNCQKPVKKGSKRKRDYTVEDPIQLGDSVRSETGDNIERTPRPKKSKKKSHVVSTDIFPTVSVTSGKKKQKKNRK